MTPDRLRGIEALLRSVRTATDLSHRERLLASALRDLLDERTQTRQDVALVVAGFGERAQLGLFERPARPAPYVPSVAGSSTSEAAARAKAPTAESDESRVLAYIVARGARGATDDEIEEALEMRHQNASARRRGLVLARKVVDSGRARDTRSGRAATVWVAR